MLQTLEFGSSDVYAPQGSGPVSLQSKRRTVALKNAKVEAINHYAGRAARLARQGEYPGFFGAQVTLVPVCGSALRREGSLWVPLLLAETMQRLGMAREVTALLGRIKAVPKSAAQKAENRPTVQDHYDTMQVDVLAPPPTNIVLIDDVVTRGATLLAAASRIAEAYPRAKIRAFAPIRTLSRQEILAFEVPCVGTIVPLGKSARRDP